jgi:hypothetical protein
MYSAEDCKTYEDEVLNCCWEIAYISSSANDVNDKTFYRVIAPNIHKSDEIVKLYIEDWCHEICGGSPLTFINGEPARKYEVRKITREEFCDKNLKCKYCKAKLVNKYGKKYVTMEKF